MAKDDDNGSDFFDDDEDIIEEHEFEAEGWDEIPSDPEEASRVLSALEGIVPDILKRTISAGVGGISTSEERIRELLAEKKLPKEVVAYLLKQADTTKREFFRVVSREIREFLEDMDFGGELAKILTTLSLEARIEVRFIENEESKSKDAVSPKASGKVRVRQSGSKTDDEDEGKADGGSRRDEDPAGGDRASAEDEA